MYTTCSLIEAFIVEWDYILYFVLIPSISHDTWCHHSCMTAQKCPTQHLLLSNPSWSTVCSVLWTDGPLPTRILRIFMVLLLYLCIDQIPVILLLILYGTSVIVRQDSNGGLSAISAVPNITYQHQPNTSLWQ